MKVYKNFGKKKYNENVHKFGLDTKREILRLHTRYVKIFFFDSMQFCNYCAARFIHGKHENPLNIRNITSNVYLGAIIFPCLNMLICRVRSIATDESGKKP